MKNFNLNKVRKIVKAGFKCGLITISDDLFDYGIMDIGCKIGDKAFYFGGQEIEGMSLEEYNASFDIEVTTEMVSNTIWDMISSEVFSDEGWYYIEYLNENLNRKKHYYDFGYFFSRKDSGSIMVTTLKQLDTENVDSCVDYAFKHNLIEVDYVDNINYIEELSIQEAKEMGFEIEE